MLSSGRYAVRRTRIQYLTQVLQLQAELKRRVELIMRHAVSRFLFQYHLLILMVPRQVLDSQQAVGAP